MKWTLRVTLLLALVITIFLILPPSIRPGRAVFNSATGEILRGSARASSSGTAVLSPSLCISPAVPPTLRLQAEGWGFPVVTESDSAVLHLDIKLTGSQRTSWLYALVAPFPTVTDAVTSPELLAHWKGSSAGPFAGRPLLMDVSTLAGFTAKWGSPDPNSVQIVSSDQLLHKAWSEMPSWAIVPFESLDPRWKVLAVDDQSPIHNDFQATRFALGSSIDYPLTITFGLRCSNSCPVSTLPKLASTNRDPSKLTTLIMTGVTALVRATAYTMDLKGVTYPGRDIYDWLTQADIPISAMKFRFTTDVRL